MKWPFLILMLNKVNKLLTSTNMKQLYNLYQILQQSLFHCKKLNQRKCGVGEQLIKVF